MIDCREASTLTSAELDRPLTSRERIRLALHRLFCAPCRAYRAQIAAMRSLATRLRDPEPPAGNGLADDARDRIRERLRAARED